MARLREELETMRRAQEDATFGAIRKQVEGLQGKREKLAELAKGLKSGYEEAGEPVRRHTAKKKEIQASYDEFKDVLKEAGISSVWEMLKDPRHQDTEEAKGLAETRGEVRGKLKKIRETKGKIKEILGEEKPRRFKVGEGPPSPKERAVAVLEARIQKMEEEIRGLHEQTPEGKAEKKERAKKELLEKENETKWPHSFSLENVQQINWLQRGAVEIGEKYGAELAREVVTESAQASVDAAVKRRKEQEGLDTAMADIEALEALPKKYSEARELLQDIERKRALVLTGLDTLKSEKSVLETTRSEKEAPLRALEDLLSRMEERIVSPSLEYHRDGLERILQKETWVIDPGWQNKIAYKLSRQEQGLETKRADVDPTLPNFNRMIAEARRFQEFYAKLHTYLEQRRTLPADLGDIEPSTSQEEIRKINPQIAVRIRTLRILAEHHFLLTAAREGVQRRIKGIEAEGERIKNWLPAEIRRQWAKAMEEDLTRRHPEIQEIEQRRLRAEQGKQLAAKLLPELGIVKAGLAEEDLAETVALERYHGNWNPPDIRAPRIVEKLRVAENELVAMEEKIRILNAGIARLDREISGLYKIQIFKKAELEAEKEKKEDDRDVETKVAEEKKRERDVLFKKQTRIFEIRRILQTEGADAVTNEIMGSRDGTRVTMLVVDLLSKAQRICEQRRDAKLSDEEQALYDRQRVLRTEAERAREEADRIWEVGKK